MTEERHNRDSGQDPEITKLYRATRREEPSAELDTRILEQARITARHHRRRWLVPLSSAAVILLGLTLTLQLMEQEPTLPDIDDYLSEEPSKTEAIEGATGEKKQKAASPVLQAPARPELEKDSLRSREMAPAEYDAAPAASGISAPGSMMQDVPPAKLMSEPVSSQADETIRPYEEPEAWLARISALYEQGETRTAIEEMASFRQHYPDHPVPDTLKKLLPGP